MIFLIDLKGMLFKIPVIEVRSGLHRRSGMLPPLAFQQHPRSSIECSH